jgi:hypothetical protein
LSSPPQDEDAELDYYDRQWFKTAVEVTKKQINRNVMRERQALRPVTGSPSMTQRRFIDLPHYTRSSLPTALFVAKIMASKTTHEG